MIRKKVIAYLRLSKEDGDDESSSITNQRKILQDYADKHNMEIVEFYIDDGYSGYTMSRPDFNRLKADLNNNKVDTILVKDLSRLGRHSAKVQLFLENIINTEKRVISLGENYDSFNEDSQDIVGIHAWANEKLIRDTSKKVRKSIETLQKEGKWLCSIPYGYVKDEKDKYKYYIDEVTAPYVRKIFDLYIEGDGIKSIARKLTEMNAPTPSMIKKMRAEQSGKSNKKQIATGWDVVGVSRILSNEFYNGTLVLGKSKRRAINGKSVDVPEENWHRFENAHEPIIDMQTFKLVQEIMKQRIQFNYRGTKQVRPNIFAGILYCSDCGKILTSNSGRSGNTRYICRTYNVYGTSKCTSHAVSEREVKYALIDFLNMCGTNLSHIIEDLDNVIQSEIKVKGPSDSDLVQITNQIESTKKAIEILIEQKMRETIKNPGMIEMIDAMYDKMLNEKYQEVRILEQQLENQNSISMDSVNLKKGLVSAMSMINQIIDSGEITKKQVMLLVEKIVVYEDTGIDIYLKGDLHKLCDNYFHVSESKQNKINQLVCGYILQQPEKFTLPQLTVHVRESGVKISHKTLAKLVRELITEGLIKVRPMNHGFELAGTPKQLRARLIPNIVANISRSLRNNNVKMELLMQISRWANSLTDTIKKVF